MNDYKAGLALPTGKEAGKTQMHPQLGVTDATPAPTQIT